MSLIILSGCIEFVSGGIEFVSRNLYNKFSVVVPIFLFPLLDKLYPIYHLSLTLGVGEIFCPFFNLFFNSSLS